ncbi:MAG TPA: sigma-70 family RNA polymerase sigma factor, partial [Nocardioides sp.]|nr:sigma-70 family RNA polymerase sigma factor [Nocardioides sp.]
MSDDATVALEEQLLQRVRAGDSGAFQELYDAHLDGALQLARILVGRDGADELVSESFARVLSALSGGAGPTTNFRAYLHVTIRNGYRDTFRTAQEAPVSDQPWLLDEATPTVEEMVDGLDESVATDALTTLPERWQQVLWHVEVEGRKPAEVAELMDLSPRTVSSLAHRAREGLKQAYLDLHAGPEPTAEECQWVHARMSKSARGDLSARAQRKLDQHLAECDDCAAAFLVVDTVNQRLAAYVLPLVLLGIVPASGKVVVWLAAAAGGTAVAGGAVGGATTAGTGAGAGGAGGSAGSSASAPV